MTARADRLIPTPDTVGFGAAATLPVAYMTAYHMMRKADVTASDLVFIPGAAGSVGVAAVCLLDAIGARSIATSSDADKLDRLEDLGADHVVHSDDPPDVLERVTEIGPVDATLNHLSGPFAQVGVDVLRRGGTMAVCGQTAGAEVTLNVRRLYLEHKQIVGSTMGTQGDLETAVALTAAEKLSPPVGGTYPLENTAHAFSALRDRESFGSLVVQPHQ